jgi:hypothetical protein
MLRTSGLSMHGNMKDTQIRFRRFDAAQAIHRFLTFPPPAELQGALPDLDRHSVALGAFVNEGWDGTRTARSDYSAPLLMPAWMNPNKPCDSSAIPAVKNN